MRVLILTLLLSVPALALSKPPAPTDPAVLGAELSRLGGAAFDRAYFTLAVTRLDATADLTDALAKHADTPALRKLGQQQAAHARSSSAHAQTALKRLGGPDLTLATRAQRTLSGFTGGLLGNNDAKRSDQDLYDRLATARGQILAVSATALTRLSDPHALAAARDLLQREADAYTALRLAAPQ